MDLSFLANLPGQSVKNPNASGNFGMTNAGSNYASATDPDLLAQLAVIRQYDPDASIGFVPPTEGNSAGMYSINYNQDKLPPLPSSSDGQLWARGDQASLDEQ